MATKLGTKISNPQTGLANRAGLTVGPTAKTPTMRQGPMKRPSKKPTKIGMRSR